MALATLRCTATRPCTQAGETPPGRRQFAYDLWHRHCPGAGKRGSLPQCLVLATTRLLPPATSPSCTFSDPSLWSTTTTKHTFVGMVGRSNSCVIPSRQLSRGALEGAAQHQFCLASVDPQGRAGRRLAWVSSDAWQQRSSWLLARRGRQNCGSHCQWKRLGRSPLGLPSTNLHMGERAGLSSSHTWHLFRASVSMMMWQTCAFSGTKSAGWLL